MASPTDENGRGKRKRPVLKRRATQRKKQGDSDDIDFRPSSSTGDRSHLFRHDYSRFGSPSLERGISIEDFPSLARANTFSVGSDYISPRLKINPLLPPVQSVSPSQTSGPGTPASGPGTVFSEPVSSVTSMSAVDDHSPSSAARSDFPSVVATVGDSPGSSTPAPTAGTVPDSNTAGPVPLLNVPDSAGSAEICRSDVSHGEDSFRTANLSLDSPAPSPPMPFPALPPQLGNEPSLLGTVPERQSVLTQSLEPQHTDSQNSPMHTHQIQREDANRIPLEDRHAVLVEEAAAGPALTGTVPVISGAVPAEESPVPEELIASPYASESLPTVVVSVSCEEDALTDASRFSPPVGLSFPAISVIGAASVEESEFAVQNSASLGTVPDAAGPTDAKVPQLENDAMPDALSNLCSLSASQSWWERQRELPARTADLLGPDGSLPDLIRLDGPTLTVPLLPPAAEEINDNNGDGGPDKTGGTCSSDDEDARVTGNFINGAQSSRRRSTSADSAEDETRFEETGVVKSWSAELRRVSSHLPLLFDDSNSQGSCFIRSVIAALKLCKFTPIPVLCGPLSWLVAAALILLFPVNTDITIVNAAHPTFAPDMLINSNPTVSGPLLTGPGPLPVGPGPVPTGPDALRHVNEPIMYSKDMVSEPVESMAPSNSTIGHGYAFMSPQPVKLADMYPTAVPAALGTVPIKLGTLPVHPDDVAAGPASLTAFEKWVGLIREKIHKGPGPTAFESVRVLIFALAFATVLSMPGVLLASGMDLEGSDAVVIESKVHLVWKLLFRSLYCQLWYFVVLGLLLWLLAAKTAFISVMIKLFIQLPPSSELSSEQSSDHMEVVSLVTAISVGCTLAHFMFTAFFESFHRFLSYHAYWRPQVGVHAAFTTLLIVALAIARIQFAAGPGTLTLLFAVASLLKLICVAVYCGVFKFDLGWQSGVRVKLTHRERIPTRDLRSAPSAPEFRRRAKRVATGRPAASSPCVSYRSRASGPGPVDSSESNLSAFLASGKTRSRDSRQGKNQLAMKRTNSGSLGVRELGGQISGHSNNCGNVNSPPRRHQKPRFASIDNNEKPVRAIRRATRGKTLVSVRSVTVDSYVVADALCLPHSWNLKTYFRVDLPRELKSTCEFLKQAIPGGFLLSLEPALFAILLLFVLGTVPVNSGTVPTSHSLDTDQQITLLMALLLLDVANTPVLTLGVAAAEKTSFLLSIGHSEGAYYILKAVTKAVAVYVVLAVILLGLTFSCFASFTFNNLMYAAAFTFFFAADSFASLSICGLRSISQFWWSAGLPVLGWLLPALIAGVVVTASRLPPILAFLTICSLGLCLVCGVAVLITAKALARHRENSILDKSARCLAYLCIPILRRGPPDCRVLFLSRPDILRIDSAKLEGVMLKLQAGFDDTYSV